MRASCALRAIGYQKGLYRIRDVNTSTFSSFYFSLYNVSSFAFLFFSLL